MANTYTQLYFHVIFAVKGRKSLIQTSWREELYKYISGIISSNNLKLMIIDGMPDHVHILLGTKPDINLSHEVRDIKANSSKWINEKGFVKGKFEWQEGFGAFTLGHFQLPTIINYIMKQEEHHSKKSFKEEYLKFLNAYEVDFNDAYLFDEIE